jgi:hypothetical protein
MNDLFILILLFVLGVTVWGVWLGWSGKAVFFMDADDLKKSLIGWVALFGGIFLAVFTWNGFFFVGASIAAYYAYDAVRRSFSHNNNDWHLALPVGIAKVVLSEIYAVHWLQMLSPLGETAEERLENRFSAAMTIGLLTVLFTKLINGEEVLARRTDNGFKNRAQLNKAIDTF